MSDKDLKLEPHNLKDDAWWYEENSGIEVHIDCPLKHHAIKISWGSLRNALKRKDK